MATIFDYPVLVFVISLPALWLSAQGGAYLRRRRGTSDEGEKEYLGVVVAATLTLLALIIGFSFSMAINRYDLRKNYEEAEANAIGTEYLRVDLLPAPDASRARVLLRSYLDHRISFYQTRDVRQVEQVNAATARLQNDLWSAVRRSAAAQPTPVAALVVSGMNDVLNSQGYTQAAWWNRIPIAAWALMVAIAVCSNFVVGYGAQRAKEGARRFFYLPLIVSISFLLIADLDSPNGGLIRVHPQNLVGLSGALREQ
jgi:hypothetical protein